MRDGQVEFGVYIGGGVRQKAYEEARPALQQQVDVLSWQST